MGVWGGKSTDVLRHLAPYKIYHTIIENCSFAHNLTVCIPVIVTTTIIAIKVPFNAASLDASVEGAGIVGVLVPFSYSIPLTTVEGVLGLTCGIEPSLVIACAPAPGTIIAKDKICKQGDQISIRPRRRQGLNATSNSVDKFKCVARLSTVPAHAGEEARLLEFPRAQLDFVSYNGTCTVPVLDLMTAREM